MFMMIFFKNKILSKYFITDLFANFLIKKSIKKI